MESAIGEMKRIQLFEFEDFGWFPDWLIDLPELLAGLIADILKKKQIDSIVDL